MDLSITKIEAITGPGYGENVQTTIAIEVSFAINDKHCHLEGKVQLREVTDISFTEASKLIKSMFK